LKKNSFVIKIDFLNIPRLWKFAQGDLGGIWTQGFFLNSSRLLKYFIKMKYDMPCYATLGKNFTLYYLFKMQPNALPIQQNFIVVKSGCSMQGGNMAGRPT
jgi:hypothetical protein